MDCAWMVWILTDIGFFADTNGLEETSKTIDLALEALKQDLAVVQLKGELEPLLPSTNDPIASNVIPVPKANWERRIRTLCDNQTETLHLV